MAPPDDLLAGVHAVVHLAAPRVLLANPPRAGRAAGVRVLRIAGRVHPAGQMGARASGLGLCADASFDGIIRVYQADNAA
ncbi:MAG: hypothetical protein Q4F13_08870 [Pseudomonadota bacterium]|nr:hypothetical protein [Pseudomonadota bacterium]